MKKVIIMKQVILTTLSLGLFLTVDAQYAKVNIEATDKMVKEESGIVGLPLEAIYIGANNPPSMDQTWQPMLIRVSKNESENDELLEKIKEEKNKLKEQFQNPGTGAKTTASATPPVLGINFAGLNNNGLETPLDNTIAISDKDTIVAFVNSKVGYYTTTGTMTYSHDVYAMIGDATLSNSLCDPKVIWDNVARRFIFYMQTCDQVSATSTVVLGFSITSNPADGWRYYKFTGNPAGNGTFFDYPKIAVSNDELFVTGNSFSSASGSYVESIIYQIQKAPCFAGTTPLSKYYRVNYFTPLPVGYGQSGSYGPGIYLVSTGGSTTGTNVIKLMNITNNIASGTAVLNSYNVPTTTFSTGGSANQMGTTLTLNTGDCRALDGFYLKGTIHFVFTKDIGSGWCGLCYNRLTVSTLTDLSTSLGLAGTTDLAYPAVASPGKDSNDKSVIIAYNESTSAMYPRTCAVRVDQSMNWSSPLIVKSGLGFISYPGTVGPTERWGDYTGICKRYGDNTGTLWMAGMYGNSAPTNDWLQWIAKINPYGVGVNNVQVEQTTARVYPNPVVDNYKVKFDVPERQNIMINITDMSGRTVVELYNGMAEMGEQVFSFNKASMSPGLYSLNIVGATTNIKNEKIVIAGK